MSELGIETTTACTFNCRFCSRKRKKITLSTEVFKRVVDEAIELGYDSFALTPKNGDIFCDPDVYSKLEYIRDKEKYHWFFTNLHLVNSDKLKDVISPFCKIYFSEYGKSDEEFENLTRRPRSFRYKVLENYKQLRNYISIEERNDGYIKWADTRQPSSERIKKIFCTQCYNHGILSNGDVILCACGAYNPDLIVGNIINSTLKDVFTSNLYRDKIKHYMMNGMDSFVCRNWCNTFRSDISPKQLLRNLRL